MLSQCKIVDTVQPIKRLLKYTPLKYKK